MNPSPVQNLWLDLTNANEGRTHSNLLFGACGILPEIFDPGGINVMMPSASTEKLRKQVIEVLHSEFLKCLRSSLLET